VRKKQAAAGNAPTSLRIGEPDDAFEREADRIADEIMAGGMLKRNWSISSIGMGAPLQRKCGCGGGSTTNGECEECKKKKEDRQVLQRKALVGASEPAVAPSIVEDVLNSPGQRLDKVSREFFEPHLGYDLSAVRVHSDSVAAESANCVHARAYTVGEHIVFPGLELSGSPESRKLLAHELVHTIQQGTGERNPAIQRAPTKGGKPDLSYRAVPEVLDDLGDLMNKFYSGLDPAKLDEIERNKTVVIGLVVEDETAEPRYVWTAAGNWNDAKVAAELDKLGVTRVNPGTSRQPRGAEGARGDAEQRLLEDSEDMGFTVKAMVVSRHVCVDCDPAIKDYEDQHGPVLVRVVPVPKKSAGTAGGQTPADTPATKPGATGGVTEAEGPETGGTARFGTKPGASSGTGEGEVPKAGVPRIGSAIGTGLTAFNAALMAFNLAEYFGILSDPLQKQVQEKINQSFRSSLSQPQWQGRVKDLQPVIDQALSNIFYNISYRLVYAGSHSPYPKFPSRYDFKNVDLLSIDIGHEEKSGCGKLDPPERPNGAFFWQATMTCSTSVAVKSGGQVRQEQRARENARMIERLRRAAPKAQPSAPSATPETKPLLPTPGPPPQQQSFQPLPGAPGPSPLREVDDRKALFAQQARDLIARGNQILSSSPDTEKAAAFKRDEGVWRALVTLWKNHYIDKGPDTGVSAMKELLESDEFGGRLKQIRQTLGG
jgi:hypothetical protein